MPADLKEMLTDTEFSVILAVEIIKGWLFMNSIKIER